MKYTVKKFAKMYGMTEASARQYLHRYGKKYRESGDIWKEGRRTYFNQKVVDYLNKIRESNVSKEVRDKRAIMNTMTRDTGKLKYSLNILQKMAFTVLTNNMEISLFMNDDEIKKNVSHIRDNNTLRALFANYTTEEILDVIVQTMESDC